MKKLITLLLVLSTVTLLMSCMGGNGAITTTSPAKTDAPSSATAPATEPTYSFRFKLNDAKDAYYVAGMGPTDATEIVIPDSYKGLPVTLILDGAFKNKSNITSITIPDSVRQINTSAFSGCTGLTSITLPEGLGVIQGGAFAGCSGLTSITIPKSVWFMNSGICAYCENLESITVAEGSMRYYSEGNCLIESINGIKKLLQGCKNSVIPSDCMKIDDFAFSGCKLPADFTIPESVTEIGISAFYACTGFTSVSLPEGLTAIGDAAFANCAELENITLSSSIRTIGKSAFYECGLVRITIPDGVTEIEYWAFEKCNQLTNITIPASVTNIYAGAFSECYGLKDIYYAGTKEQWESITIEEDFNEVLTTVTIHFGTAG